ncbi:hypothetical protein DPMN_066230 [Dreissena polymorpha]|uniref:Uncharacterized protein n=1 Tax=Dreissena polymorpha TaxID=45954 RepID=A0A9D3YXF4_DREPO|nr:hypothetical protein DPMN_066230 [Dreissena polymorpha]
MEMVLEFFAISEATTVRNTSKDRNTVTAKEARSPDDIGSTNVRAFKNKSRTMGMSM